MDEQKDIITGKDDPQTEPAQQEAPKRNRPRNWVTDLYDKMHISVRALDIMIVFLAVFILAVIIIASQNR